MKKNTSQNGFTLIEILVSIALFSMVMVVALGALLSLSVASRKAEAINSAINNLSSSLDSMSRAIRTGKVHSFYCGIGNGTNTSDCPSGGSEFTFTSSEGPFITYCLQDPTAPLYTCSSSNTFACPTGKSCAILRSINGGPFSPLTAPDTSVNYLDFVVNGSTEGDTVQPLVNIFLTGSVQVTANQSTPFLLQTSVEQRIYDL